MKNILSNRFFQAGIVATGLGIAFFAFQTVNEDETAAETAAAETAASADAPASTEASAATETTQVEATDAQIENNSVNNAEGANNNNVAAEETTN